jgi:hypothetical protein
VPYGYGQDDNLLQFSPDSRHIAYIDGSRIGVDGVTAEQYDGCPRTILFRGQDVLSVRIRIEAR